MKYKIIRADRACENVEVNDFVYSLKGWDYGLAGDDTRLLGIEHKSVTKNEDGDYPSFTIPVEDLEKIE